MTFCTACTPDLAIPEQGYLLLLHSRHDTLPLLEPFYTKDKVYAVPYRNPDELSDRLTQINSETETANIKAALAANPKEAKTFSPFGYIYERVVQRDLVDLIMKGDFSSFFQPIVHLESGSLYGYESLLRSFDPPVSPFHLFGTAIKTGLQSILDRRARELAIMSRSDSIKPGIKSFINFIPSSIYNPEHCLQHTFKMVKQYGVRPDDLIFEVVETEKIKDINHLKNILDTYRAHGMKVALDDLGSGYSTYEVLEKLKPDYVKIDRQYISDCYKDPEKQTFLNKVQGLARELSITVLAEGIESEEEFSYLQSIDIHLGQGYFIGKPAKSPASQESLFSQIPVH
ncbi:EAL domain-containing protein [Metabacillus sp. 84]|uniref:EAL domain-containing protein n=1 Tax=Metabacillus sp. 84 TaxID=3404705 RepID=UPI003CEAF75D